MKKCASKAIKYALVFTLCLTMATPAMADTKEEVQERIEDLEEQQNALEDELSALKENKSDTESYISDLDEKIAGYVSDLEEIGQAISKTQAEISIAQDDLAQAKDDEQRQYKALKARIKTIYENGDKDYLELLFGSGSIKSLLNNQEYVSKINEYDANLLTSLQETRDRIAAYEAKLEEKEAIQQAQKDEYEAEKADLEKVVEAKTEELMAINADIDDVATDISELDEVIAGENAILEQILEEERRAAEEEARRKAEEEAARAAAEEARRQAEAEEAARRTAEEAAQQEAASQEEENYDYDDDEEDYNDYEDTSSSTSYSSESYMIWPCSSTYISSYFGYREAPTYGASTYHEGIDIAGYYGESIYAAMSGTVTTAGWGGGTGNYIVIDHGNGLKTVYMHLADYYVSAGQYVSQGSTIGAMGSTGISTGTHLHFSVIVNGEYVDPLWYVSP